MCRIYNKKDRIRNEDVNHSKDASSISLPENDRRELMENFNGAGQDYEDLSNNNVTPLANNGALVDSRIYGQDYKDLSNNNVPTLANNIASFPNPFQAMDGNYGTYNMVSFPNQFQAMDGNYRV